MASVMLLVIGDGREELLARTIESVEHNLKGDINNMLMVNDKGDPEYSQRLIDKYGDRWSVISHNQRSGLSESVRTGWAHAERRGVDYVFHLEEDFVFTRQVHLENMINVLEDNPDMAQLVLKRQPVNIEETEAGGYMYLHSDKYHQEDGFVSTKALFSLNPCLYPMSITDVEWPAGGGEREFTDAYLEKHPEKFFAIWGTKGEPPIVNHTGHYRSDGWLV